MPNNNPIPSGRRRRRSEKANTRMLNTSKTSVRKTQILLRNGTAKVRYGGFHILTAKSGCCIGITKISWWSTNSFDRNTIS